MMMMMNALRCFQWPNVLQTLTVPCFICLIRHAATNHGVDPNSDLGYLLHLAARYYARIHSPETGANTADFINNATDEELATLAADLDVFQQDLENFSE